MVTSVLVPLSTQRAKDKKSERLLAHYPSFISVGATAETTTLASNSIDLIVAGQSFHWFDRAAVKLEFKRILQAGGWVVLVWNGFRIETSAVVRGYHELSLIHI